MPHIRRTASTAPLPPRPRKFLRDGCVNEAVDDAAVVVTVSTLLRVPPAVRARLVGFNVQAGGLCAPVGEAVSAQVRLTVPAYVLPAVKVAVAVALDPGATAGGVGMATVAGGPVTVSVTAAEVDAE
jgi:hypothetical protein